MKSVKFYTLGCKVNQYDTQSIREHFLAQGFKEVTNAGKAVLYVINTCTVTHRADAQSLYYIRRAKRENPRARIIVTGCLTKLDSRKIRAACGSCRIIRNTDKQRIDGVALGPNGITYFSGHSRAFLKIQDGCDNSCSYCKVPLVRGKSRSKDFSLVLNEARQLAQNGYKEIVLCGICLGSYGKDLKPQRSIVDVIKQIEEITGLLRIRLSSIEAGDVSNELISCMSKSKKLCHHLHIPVQSGDDAILKKMRRKYTRRDYIALVDKLRQKVPDIAITTDVLVGFPGEDEDSFEHTCSLVRKICPLKVHIFPYSRREHTYAAGLKGEAGAEAVNARQLKLERISQACALAYQKKFLHKEATVLIEGKMKGNPDYWEGLTDNYLRVYVKSRKDLSNQDVLVKLEELIGDGFRAV